MFGEPERFEKKAFLFEEQGSAAIDHHVRMLPRRTAECQCNGCQRKDNTIARMINAAANAVKKTLISMVSRVTIT